MVADLCREIKRQVGNRNYRGGIYPENISRNPDGSIGIGPAKKSDWSEKELLYIAPEIYWNNRPCPQSDVYSLGLILYFAASGGHLPFEDSSNNAQLMRMSGKTVYAPAAAGTQLGNIIEKALRFKESERYQTPEELAVMLDYCVEDRLINPEARAEELFRKNPDDLSEMEKTMLSIMEEQQRRSAEVGSPDDRPTSAERVPSRTEESAPMSEAEIFSAAGLTRPEPVSKGKERIRMEDYFGLDSPDPIDLADLEAEEEIRVYEPGKRQNGAELTDEDGQRLAPVTVKKKKAPQKSRRQEEEDVQQKRRPFLVVVLLLCVLLIAAVVARILIGAFSDRGGSGTPSSISLVNPTVPAEPEETMDFSSILSEEQIQYQQQLAEQQAEQQAILEQEAAEAEPEVTPGPHTYEAIRADVGWLEAKEDAIARGGLLVTIDSEEELETVVQLAREAGFDRVWIGAHRENGVLVWENGADVTFYRWDTGEPSYTDSGDGAAEDYVMLWEHNGRWVYNDSRENPLTDFYGMYGGRVGYVVEYNG